MNYVSTSVVVQAEQLHKAWIHPTELVRQEIVPADWELDPGQPLHTLPAQSLLRYTNGYEFFTGGGRFHVRWSGGADEAGFGVAGIARLCLARIDTLTDIAYDAVGINFSAFVPLDASDASLVRWAVKPGSLAGVPEPTAMGLQLVYEFGSTRLKMDIASGTQSPSSHHGPALTGVLFEANYHTALDDGSTHRGVKAAVDRFDAWRKHFENYIGSTEGLV